MIRLGDIRGQDRAIATLRRALAGDRVPHAYLFCGPAHCGKYTTGLALAGALNCETAAPGEDACGECGSCGKIRDGIHPDVRTLEREGAAQIIPIETIRSEVLARIGLPPHEGKARVFLIEEAGALAGPSANALLKTLEEPPARTHFVLCTTAPDQLLPTIRSRCQRVSFAALPPDLQAQVAQDDDAAQRLGQLVDQLLAAVDSGDAQDMHAAALAAAQEKTDVLPVLQLLTVRLHALAKQAAHAGDLNRAVELARRATVVLSTEFTVAEHNAHGQLAFDSLLRQLR